jgi:superfamily II DNA or RNA helicase
MSPSIYFQGGTLVLKGLDESDSVPAPFQWIKAGWRCEAYHYPRLHEWLRERGIRDTVPRWQRLDLDFHDERQPHDYQLESLAAWEEAGGRGSIVLPTGAGKTYVAIHAIQRINRSALVVAPTIDLLHQWYARLVNVFATEVGVYYGGEKIVQPLTVTTYHSSGDLVAEQGNAFKLIIFDEVHHLPAPSWGETALMSPAPARLGLTATYPEEHEQVNGRFRVEDLIGSIVYQKRIDDLAGEQLAAYRTERVRVNLTPDEREQYDHDYAIYAGFFRSRQLRQTHGAGWLRELMRLSAFEREARRALLARLRILQLLAASAGKLQALDRLLREHFHDRVLVFTESNAAAYQIARLYLIPVITHETKAAERKHILDEFRAGGYRAVVTSRVLNEGVDVPEAKVAIVLGGTASAREYIQRLGRVLRKVGNRNAVLYELIVRNTVDEGRAARRRRKART